MSGIEVAGLVLAVLPLLISAAEHYRSSSNFVARAIKKEFLTAQYRDELIQQRVLLKLYIKGVVGKTDLSNSIQAEIANNPASGTWQDPKVLSTIAEELSDAYEPFVAVLARVSRILVRIVKTHDKPEDDFAAIKQLQGLYKDSVAVIDSEAERDGVWNRLKFSWKSSEWKSMIEELQTCNSMLERLSLAADRAKPYAKKQKSQAVHAAFEHRMGAEKLFNILQSACDCQPAGLREIGIRLQVPLACKNEASAFRLLIVDANDIPYEISARVHMVPEYTPTQQVKMVDPKLEENPMAKHEKKLLRDICSETRAAFAVRAYLHLFADHSERVYCSSIKPDSYKSIQPIQKHFSSLSNILKECEAYNTKRWLHKEKSILAINLAYALLQLHDGPWHTKWTSENITFMVEERKSKTGGGIGQISLRQPYTRLSFSSLETGQNPVVSETTPRPKRKRQRRNIHLHALGIVLMELFLNRSMEEYAKEEETDDLRGLAQELLEEHADDMSMSTEYLEAVRFCLSPRPNPQTGSFDFTDEGFREIYYSEVINMLEEHLLQRFDTTEHAWLPDD